MKKTLLALAAATALVFGLASCNTPANTDTTNSNTNTEATAETPTNEAEKTDEEAPEATPEAEPEAKPEAEPEATPEAEPEAEPETTPEATEPETKPAEDTNKEFVVDGDKVTVSLVGKTVKNEQAFERAYAGYQITFGDDLDITDYKTLKIGVKFYDADGTEIAATWGLGQYILLDAYDQPWNEGKCQYNLGMQDMDVSESTKVRAIAIQNSTKDVAFVEVTSITFEK